MATTTKTGPKAPAKKATTKPVEKKTKGSEEPFVESARAEKIPGLNWAVQAAENLKDAEKVLQTRTADLQSYCKKYESQVSALERGDESVTAEDLATAKAEVERAEALVKAATVNVQSLRKQSTNTETSAAEALVRVIDHLFDGLVDTQITITPADESKHNPPMVFLRQRTAGKNDGGVISGAEVEVRYLRNALYAELTASAFDKAAAALGFETKTGGSNDSLKVKVHRAWLDTPTIATAPSESDARHWVQGIAGKLATAALSVVPGTYESDGPYLTRVQKDPISIDVIEKAGKRHATVAATISVNPPTPTGLGLDGRRYEIDPIALERAIKYEIDQWQNIASRGLGVPGQIDRTIKRVLNSDNRAIGQRRIVEISATFVSATK